MSLGGSSQKSNSQQQSQSTSGQTIDPGILSSLQSNLQRAQGVANTPVTPYSGSVAAGFGGTALPTAVSGATGLLNYQAPTTTASTYNPAQIASTNLTPYENPYQNDVVNTTMAQLQHQQQIADAGVQGQATQAGAFGGSRSAVLQNLNDASYNLNDASTLAGLNAANFNQAQAAAGSDVAAQNAAGQFGAGATNTSNLANQAAGLTGAGIQTTNAGLLGQLGTTQQSAAQTGLNNQYQEYLNQLNLPIQYQQLLNQSLGLLPNPVLSSSQSTGSGTSSGSGFSFSASAPKGG